MIGTMASNTPNMANTFAWSSEGFKINVNWIYLSEFLRLDTSWDLGPDRSVVDDSESAHHSGEEEHFLRPSEGSDQLREYLGDAGGDDDHVVVTIEIMKEPDRLKC